MVGISFGMEFIPIYMKHPDVYEIAIADTNLELIKTAQEKFGISSKDCYDNYDDMLKDDAIDAIHIVTPPSTHAEFSIKALKAESVNAVSASDVNALVDEYYEKYNILLEGRDPEEFKKHVAVQAQIELGFERFLEEKNYQAIVTHFGDLGALKNIATENKNRK